MFITPAYAQAAGGAAPGGLEMFLPFILIIVVFYFLIFRPQQKKMKAHREMLANIRRGDRVVTGGGIIGRVVRLEGEKELIVEIAPDVRVRVMRGTISEVLAKGEPAKGESEGGEDEGESEGKGRRRRKSAEDKG